MSLFQLQETEKKESTKVDLYKDSNHPREFKFESRC